MPAAARFFEQAVEMTRANQDLREQAIALANLAWIHNRQGFIARAAGEYEALMPMIEKRPEPYQYAAALGNYGFCLIALGDFDRALSLHTEALELFTAHGQETSAPSSWRRSAACTSASVTPNARSTRCAPPSRCRNASAMRIGQASTLRVAGNAAATLGRTRTRSTTCASRRRSTPTGPAWRARAC